MSWDTVDDLHAAEDHIGVLEALLRDVVMSAVEELEGQPLGVRGFLEIGKVRSAIRSAGWYCRASCAAGDCDDDCGCQAHGDGPHPKDDHGPGCDGVYNCVCGLVP